MNKNILFSVFLEINFIDATPTRKIKLPTIPINLFNKYIQIIKCLIHVGKLSSIKIYFL